MNNQFDELTRSLAQSVTRRAAFKKMSIGLAGMGLDCKPDLVVWLLPEMVPMALTEVKAG